MSSLADLGQSAGADSELPAAQATLQGLLLTYSGSGFDATRVQNPTIFEVSGVYEMLYAGLPYANNYQIGLATSTDGVTWTRYQANPVISNANSPNWDSFREFPVSVDYVNGIYQLWFEGDNSNLGSDPGYGTGFGYATSTDGVHWSQASSNPIRWALSSPNGTSIDLRSVVYFDGEYQAYYLDQSPTGGVLYHAVSEDGATFTGDAPLGLVGFDMLAATTTTAFGSNLIFAIVSKNGDDYYATSSDGKNFTIDGVLDVPANFGVSSLVFDGGELELFGNMEVENANFSYGSTAIAYATVPVADLTLTDVWTEKSGDDHWNAAANWSLDQVPTLGESIQIGSSTSAPTVAVTAIETVYGSIVNYGEIALQGGGPTLAALFFRNDDSLTGGGKITLSDSDDNILLLEGGSLDNVDDTIAGSGYIVSSNPEIYTLTNGAGGVIDASGTNNALKIDGLTLNNDGLIEATGGGGLILDATMLNQSATGILLANDGNVTLAGDDVVIGGTLEETSAFRFLVQGAGNELDGVTIDAGAVVEVGPDATLDLAGTVVDNSAIINGATFEFRTDGNTPTGTATLLLADDTLIAGPSTGGLQNNATIEAVGSGTSTIAVSFFNQGTVIVNSGTLAFSGPHSDISGLLAGTGTVAFTGGGQTIMSGVTATVANLAESHADLILATDLAYGGDYDQTGGTLSINVSFAFTLTGEATFEGGVVGGAGALDIAGGTSTIGSGAYFSIADWSISGAQTTVDIEQNLVYGGAFSLASGATLDLTGFYDLTTANGGTADLSDATVGGSGRLLTGGATTITGGLTIEGTAWLGNSGTLTQSGGRLNLIGIVDNVKGGTYEIADNSGIGNGGGGLFYNNGSFTKTGGTGVSFLEVTIIDMGSLTVRSGTLALDGGDNIISGALEGSGTIAFYSGSATLEQGTTATVANLVFGDGNSSSVTVATNFTYGGDFIADTVVNVDAGDTLTLTGESLLDFTVGGAGALDLAGGGTTNVAGIISVNSWSISGAGTSVSIEYNFPTLSYGGAFSLTTGATLDIYGNENSKQFAALALTASGTASLSDATVDGNGLLLTGGSTTITGGLTIGGNVYFGNTGTIVQRGGDVTIGDQSSGGFDLYDVPDSTRLDNVGPQNGNPGTYEIADNSGIDAGPSGEDFFINNGMFEKTGGTGTSTIGVSYSGVGSVIAKTGTIAFSGASTVISGALGGAGTIAFTGGDATLAPGVSATVAELLDSADVELSTNLAYGGDFDLTATGEFSIGAGVTFTLTGAHSTIDGTLTGGGSLITQGNATTITSGLAIVSNSTAGSPASLENTGLLTQSGGAVTLQGANALSYPDIENVQGATWDLVDNSGITDGATNGFTNGAVYNYGTFEKTGGAGESVVAPIFTNDGSVVVSSGTLDFQGAVTGTGTDLIFGAATLEFNSTVATAQTALFVGPNGTLDLGSPQGFSGAIEGFDTSGQHDTLELGGAGWLVTGFTENGSRTQGMLTLSDGGSRASLLFDGAYSQALFSTHSQVGATYVTYA